MILRWDPKKHNACRIEVDIMIAFDKKHCPTHLYDLCLCLEESFVKMSDDILEDLTDHVKNSDSFRDLVHTYIDCLSEENTTEKPYSYSLAHSTQRSTYIFTAR